MFIDETTIEVKGGDGGDGCYAYDRQKYRPKGPPSGGNGGRGGHVYMKGSAQLHTLQDVAYHHSYKAGRGMHGKGSRKDGRMGDDVVVAVPLGTVVFDSEDGRILHDCLKHDESIIVAKGGRGGRGNVSLASSRNPNPETVEPGKPGQKKRLRLVLKVLADIGLVGRPNAGKSTFLASVSGAHPKIADYPFTTTEPNLGIVKARDGFDSFVLADIPGLIEGSHEGRGMGIRFLRHIERTRVLAIMVESTSAEPRADAEVLLDELRQYSPLLAAKPKCYLLTKCDIAGPRFSAPRGWLPVSSATHAGIKEVLAEFWRLLQSSPDGDSPSSDV